MITHRAFKEKVTVRFTRREGGGLRATCDAVPGFLLSGSDPQTVLRNVVPALETLIRVNLGIVVTVYPLKYGIYQVEERDGDDDLIPESQDYMIDRQKAA